MKIKELTINTWMKENVRHRTFNGCLIQSPGIFFLSTRAILYPTTEKNHPVCLVFDEKKGHAGNGGIENVIVDLAFLCPS